MVIEVTSPLSLDSAGIIIETPAVESFVEAIFAPSAILILFEESLPFVEAKCTATFFETTAVNSSAEVIDEVARVTSIVIGNLRLDCTSFSRRQAS